MKKLLLSATALVGMAGIAAAADLPARAPAVAPAPYAAPLFTWTGFYVGVNAGAAWHNNNNCGAAPYVTATGAPLAAYAPACNSNNSDVGFIGGGQAGYNWQAGSFVFGLEGDIDWVGHNNNNGYANYLYASGGTNYYYTYTRANDDFLATIRGRVGFTAWSQALLYVTGGVAFRSNNHDSVAIANTLGGATVATYTNTSDNNVGWALGGGLEWAFSNNWSVKVEYLHAQFSNSGVLTTSTTTAGPGGVAYNAYSIPGHKNSIDTVRVGLNYRFGGVAASPVLARY